MIRNSRSHYPPKSFNKFSNCSQRNFSLKIRLYLSASCKVGKQHQPSRERMTVQCQNEIKCLAPLPWRWWWFNKMPKGRISKENSSSQRQKLHHKISFLFVGVIIVLGGCLLLGRFCIIASGCIVVGAYKLTYFEVSLKKTFTLKQGDQMDGMDEKANGLNKMAQNGHFWSPYSQTYYWSPAYTITKAQHNIHTRNTHVTAPLMTLYIGVDLHRVQKGLHLGSRQHLYPLTQPMLTCIAG